ncbi:unnamed protein product [Phyllotreta striolata]|uniref:Uncharacterized protein n=1 Tax=Phyllotreta striolata TaxID=444603 RepID=A0A9N9TRW5_PHYSR|nr:unnamed protein product [Phyllotreta striolata]
MTDDGWVDLRNAADADVPFRLYREEGRAFLQWSGYGELRNKLAGRLVLINLMCREIADEEESTDFPRIQMLFSPCVAFRVVGTPIKQPLTNVSEVAFVQDQALGKEATGGDSLSVTEYVAIGVCSILLGLIYVASVFLYLHLKKKKSNSRASGISRRSSRSVRDIEEGIIKSNPLLSIGSHFLTGDAGYSDTNSSDNDPAPDIIKQHEDRKKQITALVHSQKHYSLASRLSSFSAFDGFHHDSNTNERIPDENVSIVETLDVREDKPENIKAIAGSTRKKLYFNPAYFEPHLLLEPPPAALEFLTKIREVIASAKQKLATKRFNPTLLNIPEEETHYAIDSLYGLLDPAMSRRSSIISLKRENSRRRTCSGCPGCDGLQAKLPELPSLVACQNCTLTSNESKQRIRKWLEDVPSKSDGNSSKESVCPKTVRSPQEVKRPPSFKLKKPVEQPPPPPVSYNSRTNEENYYYSISLEDKDKGKNCNTISKLPPPDMIHEAMAFDKTEEKVATLTKEQMKAVIYEFTKHKTLLDYKGHTEYETDSLERNPHRKGYSTPSEYAEVPSSQPSPSLSSVLPDHEEMTIRNAIFNKHSVVSKIDTDPQQEDDHDYELIVVKKGSASNETYNLSDLLQIQKNKGYNLVSEVYVNNGYNYGSAPSTPSNSRYSSLDMKQLKVKYEGTVEKPGKLLIEVEDCMDHYIPVDESDEFEQDTLDRKPNRCSKRSEPPARNVVGSSASFRSAESPHDSCEYSGSFNRMFGSLREIYEARTKGGFDKYAPKWISDDEKGRILTLEERHSKRQRTRENPVPPDVVPPPPLDGNVVYDNVEIPKGMKLMDSIYKPNASTSHRSSGSSGSPDSRTDEYKLCLLQKSKKNGNITSLIRTEDFVLKKGHKDQFVFRSVVDARPNLPDKRTWPTTTLRPEDSGYLSSDSNESRFHRVKVTMLEAPAATTGGGSETDESLGDGQSESGAESVETHSVFFGRFEGNSAGLSGYGSMDSGVIGGEEGVSSSDSETVSYTTVIPVVAEP